MHAAVAQQAQQQQSRPVLLEDKSTQSFLDWARSQGELPLVYELILVLVAAAAAACRMLTWTTATVKCDEVA